VAATLAQRRRRSAWALAPVAVMGAAAIAFGTYVAPAPIIEAVVIAGIAVPWLAWRRAQSRRVEVLSSASVEDPSSSRSARGRRLVTASGVMVVALVVG